MNGTPKYKLIADELAADIISGGLKAGTKLPGASRLAAERGVSMVTANRALTHLQERGLARRQGRSGTYVLDPSERLRAVLVPTSTAWYRDNPQMFLYLNGLLARSKRMGVRVHLEPYGSDIFDNGESIATCGCQGVVQLGGDESDFPYRSLRTSGLPWVVIGPRTDFGDVFVMEDRNQSAFDLVARMIQDGLERIAMIGDMRKENHRLCREGYLRGVADLGYGASLTRDADVAEMDAHLRELIHLSQADAVIVCGLGSVRALGWLWRDATSVALGCFEESLAIRHLEGKVYLAPLDFDQIGVKALDLLATLARGDHPERVNLIPQAPPKAPADSSSMEN